MQVFPNDTPNDPARRLIATGRLAEELGYGGFFVSDHPAWSLDPWVHLGALAVTTERVRLGINVCCVHYRHPVMLARQAADVDNLSGGRLVLGLGIGWDANEYGNFGMVFPPVRERQAALEEAVQIVRGVWGNQPFRFEGRHFRTANTRVTPAPVQRPGPPLMIAGGGEQVTLRQVARFGDACNLTAYGAGMMSAAETTAAIRHKLAVLKGHCDEAGRPYEEILPTFQTGWLILAEDEDRLRQKLARYFPDGVEARYAGPWKPFLLATTPEDAVTHYRSIIDAGIRYIIVETLDAADEETIRLFAEQVMPRVAR
jgi:alkanesulfonate monooxygenase SsuD/methylene tetrahydromethanopterin reductase-like flavin-dependent oxidoreductase (luciferase family)